MYYDPGAPAPDRRVRVYRRGLLSVQRSRADEHQLVVDAFHRAGILSGQGLHLVLVVEDPPGRNQDEIDSGL